MKVIVSHDLDHVTVWEHRSDLIVPKHLVRTLIEFAMGYVSLIEVRRRFGNLLRNKWENVEELMKFNKERGIPATFFVAVSTGNGIRYSHGDARFWIERIHDAGFDVGLHGISASDLSAMTMEYETFRSVSGAESFGVRIHNLCCDAQTLELLDRCGYSFDTSIVTRRGPFKAGTLWEFPLHIMDGFLIYKHARWQNQTLEECKEKTKRLIEEHVDQGTAYFTLLFHDMYFCDCFATLQKWYLWVIDYLESNGFCFVSYRQAISELENIWVGM